MIRTESDSDGTRLVLSPTRSMSWGQNLAFIGLIGAIYAATTAMLAARGFWLVVPWAFIDLGLLSVCFYLVSRQGRRREVLEVGVDRVRFSAGLLGPSEVHEAARTHSYVIVRAAQRAEQTEVILRLGTKARVLGAFLSPIERDQLVAALLAMLPVQTLSADR